MTYRITLFVREGIRLRGFADLAALGVIEAAKTAGVGTFQWPLPDITADAAGWPEGQLTIGWADVVAVQAVPA